MNAGQSPAAIEPAKSARASVLRGTMWVTSLFVVIVGGRMLLGHSGNRAEVLLQPPALIAAREQLTIRPKDEALKDEIRLTDQALRQRYFGHLDANAVGSWLLVVAAAMAIWSARELADLRRRLPMPQPKPSTSRDSGRDVRGNRLSVAIVAAATAGIGLVLVASTSSRLSGSLAELQAQLTNAQSTSLHTAPTPAEWLESWPMFRGPRGDGISGTTQAPASWNGERGDGLLWRSDVPWPGHNSPIVWMDRVFLTGGTAEARHVMCFDAGSGALVWDETVPGIPGGAGEPLEVPENTGFAASTAATDGHRVYAIFATGELAAFDFGGGVVWSKPLGPPENMYGHATSLVLWNNLLLLQFDQGEAEVGKSRLYAIEGATGQVRWEQRRAVPSSWTTPLVIAKDGATQVITMAEPWVISYDAATGVEIWRADCLGTDLAPSPIAAGDVLVLVSPGKHVIAFRLDGQGDVTKTHQAWMFDEQVPDIVSPVSDGERVYLLTTPGDFVCLEASSGKKLWEHAFDLEFNASPVLAGGHLYLTSKTGVTILVKAGPAFLESGRSSLTDTIHASPAFVGDRIYLRGKSHLYCIGGAQKSASAAQTLPTVVGGTGGLGR